MIKDIINITQGIVIIFATIFTARWTYKTFAYKEKIQELKELKQTIDIYYRKLQVFCARVRKKELDEEEISEKVELAQIHNRLFALAKYNLYTKSEFRRKVQDIVGTWVTDQNRLNIMQRRAGTEEEQERAWKSFESEYKQVNDLIDKEADRIIESRKPAKCR